MSAWIVSKQHIDVLVRGALEQGGFHHHVRWYNVLPDHPGKFATPEGEGVILASQLGQMLWRENHKSVNCRYSENRRTPPYVYEEPSEFLFTKRDGWSTPQTRVNPAVLAKQVHCYNYQTCEHSGYRSSKAHSLVLYLGYAVSSNVEGYEDTVWGV
jgi:hypothetical protein